MHMSARSALLNDIPSPAFQAVVDRLDGTDVANLRLVSTTVNSKATQSTNSITLRLSGSSLRSSSTNSSAAAYPSTATDAAIDIQQHLRSWRFATRCFDHVSAVQLQVSGKLSTQQWSAAVRVLALRGNVKTLHILAAAPTSPMQASSDASRMNIPGAATLPTPLPLRQLLPDLRALTITGVTVTNMSEGLPSLLAPPDPFPAVPTPAAAVSPGFKHLEALNLSCSWSPTGSVSTTAGFTAAMQLLPQTFPNLTQLTLQLPAITVPVVRYVAPHAAPAGAAAAAAAAGGPAALLAAAVNARAATATAQHFQMQSTLLAAVSAAAAALPKLQQLELVRVPDLWMGPGPEGNLVTAAPIRTAAAAAAGLPGAALKSLEGLGSWLLQQLPGLAQLDVNTVGGSCSMKWTRAAAHTSSSSNAAGMAASAPSIKLTYRASSPAPRAAAVGEAGAGAATPAAAAADTTAAGNSSSSRSEPPELLLSQMSEHLARYTSRPATEALPNITSLQLAIHPDQLHSAAAAAALAAMPALRRLKLTVLATSSRPTNFAALVTTAAAAGGGKLESLTLLPGLGRVEVTAEALLPLTAAAGGPGSSLKELRLVGTFSATTTSSSSSSGGCSQGLGSPWAVLRELQNLETLRVHQLGPAVLDLPLECLPTQLHTFDARRVHLLGPVTHRGSTAATDNLISTAGSSCRTGAPSLTALHLQDCTVDSVTGLASSSLQQLSIAATELPGGWLAAVAVWPELQHLTFWCPTAWRHHNSSSNSSSRDSSSRGYGGGKGHASGRGAAAAAAATAPAAEESSVRLLQELTGFKHLQGLVLQHLGHLNPEVLSLAVHHMPSLTHLEVSAAAVSGDFLQTPLLPATVAGSSSSSSSCSSGTRSRCTAGSSSLKFVALRLPAVLPAAAT